LRKGALNQAAYSLFLFIRDVCEGDIVAWLDDQLAGADVGINAVDRAAHMQCGLLEALTNIFGIGNKLWSMILADLLLGADPARERWTTTGAGMIAIDTLVHSFLHRTGVLRRFEAEHPYGARCYAPHGCAEIINGFAQRVDAREFNPEFPSFFPRFLQHVIWRFCATSVCNICNGRQIDDRMRCQSVYCPAFEDCDRVALHAQ
jgi:hypothetical protein